MLEAILESDPDEQWLKADGFDDAIIGTYGNKLVYSSLKCIKILMNEGLDETGATEHFSYNVSGSYIGDQTPIFIEDRYF